MHRYDRPRRLLGYEIAGLSGFVDATGFWRPIAISSPSYRATPPGSASIWQPMPEAPWLALLIIAFLGEVTCGPPVAERPGA